LSFGNFNNSYGLLLSGLFFVPNEGIYKDWVNKKSEERLVFFDLSQPKIIPIPPTIKMVNDKLCVQSKENNSILNAATSSKPPFLTVTTENDVFYRLSAFRNDKRITPVKGLAKHTYATSDNDIKEVPSGLAAVGRYALPSPLPAIHVFIIHPTPGTVVAYGTVRPNYGMAGGGVEAYFPNGTGPGTVSYTRSIPMK
jgi:hypothetical protein